MSADGTDWRPSATPARLLKRAQLLQQARAFFAARAVLEVDTPLLINAPVSDVHIHSARVSLGAGAPPLFLHTSPEYAMKRLLAAIQDNINKYEAKHGVIQLQEQETPVH